MVAFAGQKYAARSLPIMFADNSHTITSFTLVNAFDRLNLCFPKNIISFRTISREVTLNLNILTGS